MLVNWADAAPFDQRDCDTSSLHGVETLARGITTLDRKVKRGSDGIDGKIPLQV